MGPESGDVIANDNYEQWLVVSSSDETYDSDKIDSDIEAELYSIIHHKSNTSAGQDVSDINLHSLSNMSSSKVTNKNFSELNDSSDSDIRLASPTKRASLKSPNSKNKSLKRKSDLIAGILENIQSKNPVKNKKNVGKACTDSKKKQNAKMKKKSKLNLAVARTPVIESSDSDSVIYIDLDSSEVKTNIEHDTVSLSDSESSVFSEGSDSFCTSKFRNTSLPNLSLTENSNVSDPWRIDADDLYRTKKHSNRYHDRALLKCSNCDMKGHSAKFCSVPRAVKCFICGGDHMGNRCKTKLCFKCHKTSHDPRFCYQHDTDMCHLCNMRGHNGRDCPDLWRRYHLTTKGKKLVPGRVFPQDGPMFCFNCGQVGHYGSICQGPRLERWAFPTWTSVINYSPPPRGNNGPKDRFATPNRNAPFCPQMQANFTPSKFLTPKDRRKRKKKNKKSPFSGMTSLPGSSKKRQKNQPEGFPRTKKKDLKNKQLEHLQGLRRRLGQIPTMNLPMSV